MLRLVGENDNKKILGVYDSREEAYEAGKRMADAVLSAESDAILTLISAELEADGHWSGKRYTFYDIIEK